MMVAGTLAGAEVARAVDLRNTCGSCHERVRGDTQANMTYIVPPPADQAPARCRCGYDSSNDVRGGLPWARAAPARCATPTVARTARTSSLVAPSPPNASGRRRSDAAT